MKHQVYVVLCLLLLMISCSPAISVYHDYDHELDISTYPSYDWKQVASIEANQNPVYYNELNDKRIKTAVNATLRSKGYALVESSPSFLIHYHIVLEDKSVVTMDPNIHRFSPYWMRPEMSAYQYTEGTLIIDLMDANTNNLIWRGWAVAVLEDMRPESVEKRLNTTIERIFESLPRCQPGK